jgi:excisionase family DNA binding protein
MVTNPHPPSESDSTETATDAEIVRQTLTVEEAAQILGIGRTLAFEMARRGDLPALRLGRRLVVPRAALERMLRGEHDAT